MSEPIPTSASQFDTNKVVVFFETEPLSDHFEQVMLTNEVYKELTAFLQSKMPPKSNNTFVVTTNDDHAYHFADIKEWYSQDEFAMDEEG